MVSRTELRDRYRRVMDRVAQAAERSGRKPEDILVVAVTKYAAPEQIRHLLELGHADLGESRVQQLQQRVAMTEEFLSRHRMIRTGKKVDYPEKVRWHMIGSMQRNKVKAALPLVSLIHSVDTLRLAEELHTQANKLNQDVEMLLQVNISGEKSKHGFAPAAIKYMAEQIDSMAHLKLRGLMTMAPHSENPEDARPHFERLFEVYRDLKNDMSPGGQSFNILSMGMSNDFEVAIECGANVVRIGSALFDDAFKPVVSEQSEIVNPTD